MKKKIIITLVMAFMATNIFAFQIGGTLGYEVGDLKSSVYVNGEPMIEESIYNTANLMLLFPHKYGENTNWGGRVESGFIDMHFMVNYAISYSFDFKLFQITPFAGLGLVLPLGFSSFCGCTATVPVWIGDVYADIRLSQAVGILYNNWGGSINIGYIFKFGKDRS